MKIYCIPGLGFDSRIFRNLQLNCSAITYLDWIEPAGTNENVSAYAARMAGQIEEQNEKVILIGHSFGGIISHEIARIKKVHTIVLISSIKSRRELPYNFKMLRPTGLYKFFTKLLAIKTFRFWGSYQGYKTKEEKELFVDMINKQSDQYLQWALRQLSMWSSAGSPNGTAIVHLHGDLDKTFPLALIDNATFIIPKGDHFMVYKQAAIISEILNREVIHQDKGY